MSLPRQLFRRSVCTSRLLLLLDDEVLCEKRGEFGFLKQNFLRRFLSLPRIQRQVKKGEKRREKSEDYLSTAKISR